MQLASDKIKAILQGTNKFFERPLSKIPPTFVIPGIRNFISLSVAPPAVIDLETQLLEASKSGNCEQVQRLLTTYPHIVNCRDLDGRHSTPLHFAAGYNRVPVVEYLLSHGADVHAKDKGY